MHRCLSMLTIVMALIATSCSGSGAVDAGKGGAARLALGDSTYEVRDVAMTIETGEDPWFSIAGEPVKGANEDCVVGLSGGLDLYGALPATVHAPADLVGQRLRVDFTGDGDEANFCFVGMGGLAGAEEAWVTIDSVSGSRVTFTMSGTFKIYDENGDGPVRSATATGTAVIRSET